jgi:hypothetical protein
MLMPSGAKGKQNRGRGKPSGDDVAYLLSEISRAAEMRASLEAEETKLRAAERVAASGPFVPVAA